MRRTLTTVLFDMDNTLFDLVGAQIAACDAVAADLGRSDGDLLFHDYFMSDRRGFESHENIRDYLYDRRIAADGHYPRACRIYEQVKLAHIVPYETVPDTLGRLRTAGLTMAVITDAHSRDALRRLEKSGLMPSFCGLVAYDMVMVKKPAPEPFLFALEMMKARPDETLLVGDSPRRDIRPARELGMQAVYAQYGDRFSEVRGCPEAHWSIDRMDELLPIIASLNSG